jgi:mono/diheme cytochrome c family protein
MRITLVALAVGSALLLGSFFVRPSPALAAADEKKIDFVKDVQPILSASCVKCHGADPKGKKPKGGYDMTTKEKAFKDGDNKGALIKGKPEESLVYKLLLGPVGSGDDEIEKMPSKNDSLSPEQIEIIKLWIKQGAEWPDGVKVTLKE